jgi:hypothetical protein
MDCDHRYGHAFRVGLDSREPSLMDVQLVADYSGYLMASFGLGFGIAKLLKFFQILMEKI